MLLTLFRFLLPAALIAIPVAQADDAMPLDIKTDLDAAYFLIEKGGTDNNPTVVVKRTGPGDLYYTKREFDCAAHTVRYLGEGATLEAMENAEPATDAHPLKADSIPEQLSRLVCPE
jgi:hypothetical protein